MYRNHYYHSNYGVDVTRPYYYPHHNVVEEYMYDGEFGHHDQSLEHLHNPPYNTDHYDYSPLSFVSAGFTKSGCILPAKADSLPPQTMLQPPLPRKRKTFSLDLDSAEEEESLSVGMTSPTMVSPDLLLDPADPRKHYKQNHSEIEKRRRDKMNSYISELSSMIPMCNTMNRKLDKLSVLRMAVQHMKSVKSSNNTLSEVGEKNSYISDDELKRLILGAAEGFLFVVGCDRGRILYVSESVKTVLNFSQTELIGQSLFDILHPRDITKVKEQLSAFDITPRERLIDAKTMMPVKTEVQQNASSMCPGARRSFFCRIKCGSSDSPENTLNIKTDLESYILSQQKVNKQNKNYVVIHCTGNMKSWSETKLCLDEDSDTEAYGSNFNCLVAIGRVQKQNTFSSDHGNNSNTRFMEFTARHSVDGKFTNVDEKATFILGYLPQELLGTSLHEYYHAEDMISMTAFQKKVLESKIKLESGVYRFRCKDGKYIHLKSTYCCFQNPWTKETDFILSTNVVVQIQDVSSSGQAVDDELVAIETAKESLAGMCAASGTDVAMVGQELEDDAFDSSKNVLMTADSSMINRDGSPLSTHYSSQHADPEVLAVSAPPPSDVVTISVHDVTKLNGICVTPHDQNVLLENFIPEQVANDMQCFGIGGNDEETLASFFMSLLDEDGGLGGPVDVNSFPWTV
ncbi:protein cycle-like [Gigantopelta aegis]|uniref:protein cycle-like n=1 Tax=Gigantopelta aegis TaxID=1735272 RepID=UPI001B889C66|nr:protein cycle-like [Gigantopelta aegis]